MAYYSDQAEAPRLLGQTEGDHESIFPRFTNAHAACTGEVTVNGKVLRLWEYAQLETLAVPILRQRAMAIRDALGEAACPPIPSGQRQQMVQWILHMQSQLTSAGISQGRQGAGVPQSFLKDSAEIPITHERLPSPRREVVPFGPRQHPTNLPQTRDNFGDLINQRGEFSEPKIQGIQSLRLGGEGRRVIRPPDHMTCVGVSDTGSHGLQTLKPGSEGRKYLSCADHVGEQKREMDAINRGEPVETERFGIASLRPGGEGLRKIGTPSSMVALGESAPSFEPHIGGERKKRIAAQDHMINHGIADGPPDWQRPKRHQMGSFAGAKASFSGNENSYQASWKSNPSRLKGASMIV